MYDNFTRILIPFDFRNHNLIVMDKTSLYHLIKSQLYIMYETSHNKGIENKHLSA